jgi:hypothetical protein
MHAHADVRARAVRTVRAWCAPLVDGLVFAERAQRRLHDRRRVGRDQQPLRRIAQGGAWASRVSRCSHGTGGLDGSASPPRDGSGVQTGIQAVESPLI